MTTTTVITAQSVGGTAGAVHEWKKTAETATTAFIVSVQVTSGNGVPHPAPRYLRLGYSSSPFDYTAEQAKVRLQHTARFIDLPIPAAGGVIIPADSSVEALTGQYIYGWIETEAFANPLTVTISLQEV